MLNYVFMTRSVYLVFFFIFFLIGVNIATPTGLDFVFREADEFVSNFLALSERHIINPFYLFKDTPEAVRPRQKDAKTVREDCRVNALNAQHRIL